MCFNEGLLPASKLLVWKMDCLIFLSLPKRQKNTCLVMISKTLNIKSVKHTYICTHACTCIHMNPCAVYMCTHMKIHVNTHTHRNTHL